MAGPHLHTATISWRRAPDADFAKGRYSRAHVWRFDGGVEVPAAASPQIVPKSLTAENAVDPEEAFVASLSSCHLLTFLDLARRAGFVIDSYEDAAEGLLEQKPDGVVWISTVTLRPRITWAGAAPDAQKLRELHEAAHHQCFIANSVTTDVRVEPPNG